MVLIEAPLRTLPPVNFAYKLTYSHAGRTPNKFLVPVFLGGMVAQYTLPATAAVWEQRVNTNSNLHDYADTFKPNGIAALVDAAGAFAAIAIGAGAFGLVDHLPIPHPHFTVPFINKEIPQEAINIAAVKLGVNAVTNVGWGAYEDYLTVVKGVRRR